MKNENELFTTMPVGKAVAKLAVPTVISQIIVILYSMADTFFLGQTGDPNQIAALAIAFPIFTLLTAIANLFGIGANSLISRSLGKNDETTAKKASSFCFWGSLVVTAILAVVLAVFMKPILTFAGADELTFIPTKDYLLYVFVCGGLPTVAGLVLGHLVRAVGKTREAGIGLAIGGILNIILDPIFISGFRMGVAGAAIATALSNTISLLFFLAVLVRIRNTTCITVSPRQFTVKKNVSLATLSVGFPAAVSVMLVCFSISLMTGLLMRHECGNILAAAYGVTSKVGTVALHISIGIAQGVMPLIGYSYGAKNHKRVKDVTKLAFTVLWIFSIIFLIIVQFIPNLVVKIFIDDAQTIAVGSTFVRRWSWCAIGMCLVAMYDAIFQAVGKWKTSLLVAVLRFLIIFPCLCFAMNAVWGSDGLKLWLAQKKVITELAEKGGCVIVGRCADYILRDIADCLTVFIHASDEKRFERIVSVYGQREDAPVKRLHDKDKKRKAYYELYTGTSWGTSEAYSICLDSGVLGIDKCVDIIANLY